MIATARNPGRSGELQALTSQFPKTRLALLELDISNKTSINTAADAAAKLLPNGLDNLISSAGKGDQMDAGFDDM